MKKTFVVVDDAPFVRELIKHALTSTGKFSCIGEAESAAECHALVDNFDPDLVFVDLVLPDENGIEIIKNFRAQGKTHHIVALTSLSDSHMSVLALSAGADEFLLKPFSKNQILESAFKIK